MNRSLKGPWQAGIPCHKFNLASADYCAVSEWTYLLDEFYNSAQKQVGNKAGPRRMAITIVYERFLWIWHPKQKEKLRKDGSLELTFPVADFAETQYGNTETRLRRGGNTPA